MKYIGAEIKTGLAVEPQDSAAGTVTGVAIDRRGYESGVFTVITGQASGSPTTQSVILKLQECATSGGSYADVSGATLAAITANSTGGELNVNLKTLKRYVKAILTVAFTGGSTPKIEVGATYSLGEADVKST